MKENVHGSFVNAIEKGWDVTNLASKGIGFDTYIALDYKYLRAAPFKEGVAHTGHETKHVLDWINGTRRLGKYLDITPWAEVDAMDYAASVRTYFGLSIPTFYLGLDEKGNPKKYPLPPRIKGKNTFHYGDRPNAPSMKLPEK